MHLKLESTEALKAYSELPTAEQSIWLAGRILLHGEILGTLQPPEAVYHIPGDLEGTINQYHFLVMIDPNASTYVKKGKKSPISRLTIIESVGDPDTEDKSGQPMDIITLCQQVIDLGSSKLTTDIKVSVEMCGRFAFLRKTYVTFVKALATPSEKKDGGVRKMDFWGTVNKNLEELRESKNHDKVHVSTVTGDILADDRKTYGAADLDQLIKESPPMFTCNHTSFIAPYFHTLALSISNNIIRAMFAQ
ncbi:hypothetical protein DFH08DRAFT_963007 [Mycena albidolilacea]|uniref:Uncharacterized protein n=1 Tax=Mycena albidolilacea TaxID=1033008 RepID=A0AAD6ZWF8_9AGAR|nr:hypothetical protein DFH08DRAFT_963007 [Mycena albidolilacea]